MKSFAAIALLLGGLFVAGCSAEASDTTGQSLKAYRTRAARGVVC